jgi:hypothetical protein
MMPADPFMDIEEQRLSLLREETPLKDAYGALLIQFVVVNLVSFSHVCEAPGFGFIVWYCP